MSTYTTNDDLVPVYVPDAAVLPDSTEPLHEEAYRQIRRDLVAMGSTTEQLDALTDASLEALKVPSCNYVMWLLNRPSTRADSALLELAESFLTGYQRTLRSTVIESTAASESGETSRTSSGYVVLG